MILDMQPVAPVLAAAIDRQLAPGHGVDDHQRDQLLGKLAGTVIVGAIGDDHRQAIGVVPGPCQMIGPRLAGGIGRVRCIGRVLAEQPALAQAAIDLVRGDMDEAEGGAGRLVEVAPIFARGFQQDAGADDIGLDEGGGAVDGAVDMALGRQMHDRIGAVPLEDAAERAGVADIGLLEGIARIAGDRRQGLRIGGVGQLVEIDDRRVRSRRSDGGRAPSR